MKIYTDGFAARVGVWRPQRGAALVGVVFFIAIFVVLAIALATSTQTATKISRNERGMACSQAAADSGMEYIKHVLSQLQTYLPTSDSAVQSFGTDLNTKLGNLKDDSGHALALQVITTAAGTHEFLIPQIRVAGSSFSVYLQPASQNQYLVTVTGFDTSGQDRTIQNTISARFTGIIDYPWLFDSGAFTLGYASAKGTCNMVNAGGGFYAWGTPQGNLNYDGYVTELRDSNGNILYDSLGRTLWRNAASIVSAKSPTDPTNTQTISINGSNSAEGGIWIAPGATANPGKNTLYPNSWMPPIPTFDPTSFRYLATTSFVPSTTNPVYTNVYIPANSNLSGVSGTFRGILYIESPNTISFGTAILNCVIVFADKHNDGSLTAAGTDRLDFSGQVTGSPIPDDLFLIRKQLAGYGIVAPTAKITLSGTSDQTLYGSIISYALDWSGGSTRTVIDGSLISLWIGGDSKTPALGLNGNPNINMKKTPRFVKPSNGLYASGLKTYGFTMATETYQEGASR